MQKSSNTIGASSLTHKGSTRWTQISLLAMQLSSKNKNRIYRKIMRIKAYAWLNLKQGRTNITMHKCYKYSCHLSPHPWRGLAFWPPFSDIVSHFKMATCTFLKLNFYKKILFWKNVNSDFLPHTPSKGGYLKNENLIGHRVLVDK